MILLKSTLPTIRFFETEEKEKNPHIPCRQSIYNQIKCIVQVEYSLLNKRYV